MQGQSRSRRRKTISAAFLASRVVIRIACYALLVILAIYFGKQAYSFGYSVFHSSPVAKPPGRDIAVTIEENMDGKAIAELLKSKDLIRDENVFRVQEKIYGYDIYPGTYMLNTSQDVTEMLMIMSAEPETKAEKETKEEKVIPEGETKKKKTKN